MTAPSLIRVPHWADIPSPGYPGEQEPSEGKKDSGWQEGERQVAGHFNWLFGNLIRYLSPVKNGDPTAHRQWKPPFGTSTPTIRQAIDLSLDKLRAADILGRAYSQVIAASTIRCAAASSDWSRRFTELESNTAQMGGADSGGALDLQRFPLVACAINGTGVSCLRAGDAFNGVQQPTGSAGTIAPSSVAIRTGRSLSGNPVGASMFVGAGGQWARVLSGGVDVTPQVAASGTISGGADLKQVIWDPVNGLWWAVGDGGIFSSPDDTPAWTNRNNDHFFSNLLVLPTGRVCAMRSNGDVWICDNASSGSPTFTNLGFASSTGYTNSFPVYDRELQMGFWLDNGVISGTHNLIASPDGVSKTVYPLVTFMTGGAIARFRGRAVLGVPAPFGMHLAFVADQSDLSKNGWNFFTTEPGMNGAGGTNSLAGCGEVLLVSSSTGLYRSARMDDFDGTFSAP